MEENYPF